jgi:hypothetical protein
MQPTASSSITSPATNKSAIGNHQSKITMSATILSSLREKRGSADINRTQTPELIEKWRVDVGTIRLWIIGPGSDAMYPASREYYSGRIGTDEERAIAQRAVQLLDIHHRTRDAGKAEIQFALNQAAAQIHKGEPIPMPIESGPGRHMHTTAQPLVIATPDDAKIILNAVEFETGYSVAEIQRPTKTGCKETARHKARSLCAAVCRALFPDTNGLQIDTLFGFSVESARRYLIRHSESYLKDPDYAASFAAIIAKSSPTH